jgi:methanogenic corrinoid protein MtbC1
MSMHGHRAEKGNAVVVTSLLDDYLDAALSGDRARCLQIARGALADGLPIRRLYLELFQAAQYRIGELWQRNAITVGVEHLATATTQAVLSALYEHVMQPDGHGRPVLVACPPSERHEMGPRMMADLAEMAGYDVTYMGPAPASVIAEAARRVRPEVIGLSATLVTHLDGVGQQIAQLRGLLGEVCPPILVGGRAFGLAPEAWKAYGADAYADTYDTAIRFLDQAAADA